MSRNRRIGGLYTRTSHSSFGRPVGSGNVSRTTYYTSSSSSSHGYPTSMFSDPMFGSFMTGSGNFSSVQNVDAESDSKEMSVKSSDYHLEQNRAAHHTDEYEDQGLIVRRGQEFQLTINFSKPLGEHERFGLQFAVGPHPKKSKNTLADVFMVKKIDPKEWGCREVSVNNNSVTVAVFSPPDAVVGAYTATVRMLYKDDEGKEKVRLHPLRERIVILFNPWLRDDQVYMADDKDRDEYIMNETGRIYVGTTRKISAKPWNFAQFERSALDVALYLLEKSYLATEAHGNPTRVARTLSALVNNADDDGVIEGRWEGGYYGGTPPTAWNGSEAILDEYMLTKRPVKFGQCWVFSGVLTTVCRALGIPTRSVTNFQSAHDTDQSLTVDEHRDEQGRPLREYDDSIWNFHVWNEGWFKRPDLPDGNDGWQAFDSTPQERSEGMFRCGPAPVKAIKEGNVYFGYDAPFIYTEVNGDYVVWMVDDLGSARPINNIRNNVGNFISTKAVGSHERHDVTNDYKHPEGSTDERHATEKAWRYSSRRSGLAAIIDSLQGYDCKFQLDGDINPRADICVKFSAENNSDETRTIDISLYANAKYYTGTPGEEIDEFHKEIIVAPKTSQDVMWEIPVTEYLDSLDEDASMGIYAMAKVKETDQCFSAQETFDVDKPNIDIKVLGTPKKGQPFEVEVTFTNIIGVRLTNCHLTVEGPGIQKSLKVPTKKVLNPDGRIVEKVTLTPRVSGKREVIANLHSKQVNGITGAVDVNIAK